MSTLRRISLAVFLSFPPSCSGLLKVHFKRPVSGTPNITIFITWSHLVACHSFIGSEGIGRGGGGGGGGGIASQGCTPLSILRFSRCTAQCYLSCRPAVYRGAVHSWVCTSRYAAEDTHRSAHNTELRLDTNPPGSAPGTASPGRPGQTHLPGVV